MNKKLIVPLVLISIFCLTFVSALNFKEAFDKVVNNPINNLITGKSSSSLGDIQVTCTAWSTMEQASAWGGSPSPEALSWALSSQDCETAIDGDSETKFGGYTSSYVKPSWWKLKLDFSESVDEIRLISGAGYNFRNVIIMPRGGNKIWVDNGGLIFDKIQPLGVSTDSITVYFSGSYNGYPTYVGDILAEWILECTTDADCSSGKYCTADYKCVTPVLSKCLSYVRHHKSSGSPTDFVSEADKCTISGGEYETTRCQAKLYYVEGNNQKYIIRDCGATNCDEGICGVSQINGIEGWNPAGKSIKTICPSGNYVTGWLDHNSDWIQDQFKCTNFGYTPINCEWKSITTTGGVNNVDNVVECPSGKYVTGWQEWNNDWVVDSFECCEPSGIILESQQECEWKSITTTGGVNNVNNVVECPPGNYVTGWLDSNSDWVQDQFKCCSAQGQPPSTNCVDNIDNGKIENIKGTTTKGTETHIDSCAFGTSSALVYSCTSTSYVQTQGGYSTFYDGNCGVTEYYCTTDNNIASEIINCPGGCSDGKCITSTLLCGNGALDIGEQCDGGTECTNCVCNTGYRSTTPISINCELIPSTNGPTTCANGCLYSPSNKCLPLGTRKSGDYCGLKIDGTYGMIDQLPKDVACENDYECESNVCVQTKCAEPKQETGFLKRIWCKLINPLSSTDCIENSTSGYCLCLIA